eukprot:6208259-Pleurochrysis_carterae.AAC.2
MKPILYRALGKASGHVGAFAQSRLKDGVSRRLPCSSEAADRMLSWSGVFRGRFTAYACDGCSQRASRSGGREGQRARGRARKGGRERVWGRERKKEREGERESARDVCV